MHSYHNTTESSGPVLDKYETKAKSQEEILFEYFMGPYRRRGVRILMTPSAALLRVFDDRVPITSVRRALSNLTRDGKLQKAGQAMGRYGRPEYYWTLPAGQQSLF